MAKKKISEKTRQFYKGPACKPKLVANEQQMKLIIKALEHCLPHRDKLFYMKGVEQTKFMICVGLSSGLRCLKQGRAKLIINDDTADIHLSNYLNYYCSKQNIPIVQAHELIGIAPKFNLKTLLMVTFVEVDKSDKDKIESEAIKKLFEEYKVTNTKSDIRTPLEFLPPVLEKLVCTNKSQLKKLPRKDKKKVSKNVCKEKQNKTKKVKSEHD